MTDPHSTDQIFIARLREIVLANLSNENFDVEEMAREVHMNRSSIHRKLKRLTNQNASHFIREIRLKKALEMLRYDMITAAEVAYKVGFGSPTYFTKCFHEYYGYPPGEAIKRARGDETDEKGIAPEIQTTPGDNMKAKRKVIIIFSTVAIVVLALALALLLTNGTRHQSEDMSIVVLPFKNLSGNPDNQYFADGIMEDIVNSLFQISDLRVISRTTSEHFRDTDLTSGEISRQLNARNVLEGSVRRQDDKVRITVQLIDGHSEKHLWSENYDGELTDMLGLQGEIARQVAGQLDAVITKNEATRIREIPTENPEAWDYYLRARFLLHKANDVQRYDISIEGLFASLKYYEMAIAEDSTFAEAYAGLANAWYNLSAWGWYQPYFEGIQKAKDFSTKALKLDPDCAEAHAVTGAYLIWPELIINEGQKELLKAIQLDHNLSTAYQWYAQLLMITGPIDEARVYMDRGLELEPYFWVMQNLSAWIYYFEEKNDKAIDACLIARDLKPDFTDNKWLFFLNYAKLGEGEKAVQELQNIVSSYPGAGQFAEEISNAYQKAGIEGIFSWLIDVNKHNPIPVEGMSGHPFFIAWWSAILGNIDESVYWLEKNLEHPHPLYHYFYLITTNPDFDIMRDNPRFLAVIDKLGLTTYYNRSPGAKH